ncbi:MAG TPA: TrkA family potassium uptake protein [bacterium]|nr:TrkA family potassium uptake protein [bacterium]
MSDRIAYAIILGCGQLGAHLAETLSSGGSDVVVIDEDSARFAELSDRFSGFTVEGDAAELSVLLRARIDKADTFIAATDNDRLNIMTALIALEYFNIGRVLACVRDPVLEGYARSKGVEAFSPLLIAAEKFLTSAGIPEVRA